MLYVSATHKGQWIVCACVSMCFCCSFVRTCVSVCTCIHVSPNFRLSGHILRAPRALQVMRDNRAARMGDKRNAVVTAVLDQGGDVVQFSGMKA